MSQNNMDDFTVVDVLQAVVIADSYNVRFAPISEMFPRCLFPFAGATILDYTLANLEHYGFEEVILYCTAHASKIRDHIEKKWSHRLKIITIASDASSSVGDAMRDLDSKDLIRSDFILLHGDLLTNVNLKKLLLDFKRMRQKNSSCIMSIVCKRATDGDPNLSFLYEPETNQILKFACRGDKRPVLRPSKQKLRYGKMTQFHYDNGLQSTDIALCSVNVPMFLTENFDFPGIINVIKGCMVNVDIHGYSVHFHELSDWEETYRVTDMMQYSKLSFDALEGLIAPFMPSKVSGEHYRLHAGLHSFSHAKANMPPFSRLGNAVLVGEGSSIGKNCVLQRCVIGRNCSIGDNVELRNCFLWDDVIVQEDCVVDEAILCSNVALKRASEVKGRSVLSFSVIVGPFTVVDAEVLVTKEQTKRLDLRSQFGDESNAVRYSRRGMFSCTTEESDFGDLTLDVDYQKIWNLDDDESLPAEIEEDDFLASSDGGFDEEEEDYEETFSRELKETLDRCTKEAISTENVVLDINSLKHTYYIHIDVLHSLLTKCILEYPILTERCCDAKSYMAAIMRLMKTFLSVFKYYIKDEESSMCLLQSLEDTAAEHAVLLQASSKILYYLYDNDVVKEETILKWFEESGSKDQLCASNVEFSDEEGGEEDDEEGEDLVRKDERQDDTSVDGDAVNAAQFRKAVQPFIEWLQQAEEESSESD